MVAFFIAFHMLIIVGALFLLATMSEHRKIIREKKKLAQILLIAARGRRYR